MRLKKFLPFSSTVGTDAADGLCSLYVYVYVYRYTYNYTYIIGEGMLKNKRLV